MKRFHLSLGVRVALSTALATAVILLALGAWEYQRTAKTLNKELEARLSQAATRLALNLNEPLYSLSASQIASVANSELLPTEVVYIAVSDSPEPGKGNVRYFVKQADDTVQEIAGYTPSPSLLSTAAPVLHGQEKIGRFEIGLSLSLIHI